MIYLPDILTKYYVGNVGGVGWSISGTYGKTLAEQLAVLDWPEVLGPKPTLEEIEEKAIQFTESLKGFHVLPEDFYIATSVEDQNAFNRYFTLLSAGGTPDDTVIQIKDVSGNLHSITFGRFKEIMLDPQSGYGFYCLQKTFAS